MTIRHLPVVLLVCTLMASSPARAVISPAEQAAIRASGRVGENVVAALETAERAAVIVAFALPGNLRPHQLPGPRRRQTITDTRSAILAALPPGGFDLTHAYGSIDAFAGRVSVEGVLALLERLEVRRIDEDPVIHAQLNEALPLMKVSDVKALGHTGVGVTVAVIDTGIDTDHPDLADDIVDQACFCVACCPTGPSPQFGAGAAEDDNGHGTSVSGIVTGAGTAAPQGGAPDAGIVAVKVLDVNGFGFGSDMFAGLDYIIDSHPEAKLVNLSVGGGLFEGDCGESSVIDTLRANGTATFAASGNDGSGTEMNSPACIAGVISVGAVWDQNTGDCGPVFPDSVACYSNSNASTDIFAPGGYITTTSRGGGSTTGYGTSFASPAAVSCAADLLEAKPFLTPKEIELALEASPTLVTGPKNGLSFPRVDCLDALGVAGVETPMPIEAKIAIIKPGELFKFVARGTFALPDPEIDNPLVEGATLTFTGATGGQTYQLPDTCWQGLGPGGDGSKGYKCRDAGPCRVVIVKERVVKAVCTDDTGDFGPLPEPGPVDIVLAVGTATRYCTQCAGPSQGNADTVFKQRPCTAPANCP